MTHPPVHPTKGEVEAASERNRRVLILFAKMESARTAGRVLRLSWLDLDVLWTVFGSVMDPAATWAFGPIDPDENPQPDLQALLAAIAAAMLPRPHTLGDRE